MLWPALTYFTIAFQCISNETSQRPLQACVAVCHFRVCRYPMFKQTLIPQIPIDTTTSSFTTTPGIANGLIPTQSTTMNIHELAIQLSTIPKLTEYIEKNLRQNKYYIVRSNDQQSMTWRSCLRSCAVGGFCCVFGFRILGQTNQQNAPRQSKLEQVQEDRVNTEALHHVSHLITLAKHASEKKLELYSHEDLA